MNAAEYETESVNASKLCVRHVSAMIASVADTCSTVHGGRVSSRGL